MRIRIREGTARHHDAPLCHTCRHACIVRGRSLRDEIVECGRLSHPHTRVTFAVVFCTAYVNAQHPTIREMEDLAWVLRSDTKNTPSGSCARRTWRRGIASSSMTTTCDATAWIRRRATEAGG